MSLSSIGTARDDDARVPTLAALLMAVSGFAGLGYQIVWTQQLGVWLGHEIISVLAVVAAFFGGLTIGALSLGRWAARSARPVRWYAGCELVIAAWAGALIWLLPAAGEMLVGAIGPQPSPTWHWGLAFAGPFLLLLPATCAMGATLPAIERVTDRLRDEGYAIGRLYAANTLGAVIGVLGCAFVLVPLLGLANTAMICAACSLLCAIGAMALLPAVSVPRSPEKILGFAGAETRLRLLLLITGALGIGYEVVVVRVLSQVTEDTVYTFAMLLAVYLLGTAAGAAFYQSRLAAAAEPGRRLDRLLCALASACLIGTLMLWASAALKAALVAALGDGVVAALAAEAVIAVAAFALPTAVMGALFSHLCVEARAAGSSLGSAIAANTLGAALAPVVFGVLLLPWIGPKGALLLIVVSYALLLPRSQWLRPAVWGPASAATALAALTGPLAFIDLPEGGRLLSYRDGVMAAVSVVEDADGVARLRINNRQQEGSSATLATDARLAWLPLLLHPAPRHALFLGLGTGLTAGAAAEDRTLQVDAVELLPEVIATSRYFASAFGTAPNRPLPRVMAADARRYVRATARDYDVIVSDLFHPARSGAGALYTAEHFSAVRARLAAGGIFCQWLPLHQLDLATLRSIVRSFVRVYPEALAMLATNSLDTPVLGLVARPGAPRFDLAELRRRLTADARPTGVGTLHLSDDFALLGSFIAGPEALARFSALAPLNTDDRPVVTHRAPWLAYAAGSSPRERLLGVLHELTLDPSQLLAPARDPADGQWQQRLAAYWVARRHYIEAGMTVRASADPRAMLDQVREPLLAIVRASPDFAPAYDPLLALAAALAASDRADARELLTALAVAQPARGDAALLLRRLDGDSAATRPEPRPQP